LNKTEKTGFEKKNFVSKATVVIKEDKEAFGMLYAKCTDKRAAFLCCVTSRPLALADPDGSLRTGDKAKL
jgi:hypothetical protein